MFDTVDNRGRVAAGKQKPDQAIIIIQHSRTAISTLTHGTGKQLIGKSCDTAATVLNIGSDIDQQTSSAKGILSAEPKAL